MPLLRMYTHRGLARVLREPPTVPPAHSMPRGVPFGSVNMSLDVSLLDYQAYLLESDPDKQAQMVANVAEEYQKGNLKVSDVVEWIGPYVVQYEDVIKNGNAVKYFASIISATDLNKVNRFDIDHLASWFSSRMNAPGMKESFTVLQKVVNLSKARFTDDRATGTLLAIFDDAENFSTQAASARLAVFEYIKALTNHRPYVCAALDGRFIKGILALGDKEKDPKNLMNWFPVVEIALGYLSAAELQMELWDGISRYFPITYRGDPSIGITAEDLKLALRRCIAGSSLFSTVALAFLTAKIDDQVVANVKKDVIRTMDMCVTEYDLPSVTEWSMRLLDILKYEVLNVVDNELASAAISTLADVSRRLSSGLQTTEVDGTPLMRYTHAVMKDFDSYLMESSQKFVLQSGRILTAVSASSDLTLQVILKQTLPRLITVFQDTTSAEFRQDQMSIIVDLIEGTDRRQEIHDDVTLSDFTNAEDARSVDNITNVDTATLVEQQDSSIFSRGYLLCLIGLKTTLFELFLEVLASDQADELLLRASAIRGLLHLVRLPNEFLSEAEVGMFIGQLCSIIADVRYSMTSDELREAFIEGGAGGRVNKNKNFSDLKCEAVYALEAVAGLRQDVTTIVATPQLFEHLPRRFESSQDKEKAEDILAALVAMSSVYVNGFKNYYETHLGNLSTGYRDVNAALVQEFADALKRPSGQEFAKIVLAALLRGVHLRLSFSRRTNGISHDLLVDFRLLLNHILFYVVELKPIIGENFNFILSVRSYEHLTASATVTAFVQDEILDLVGQICNVVLRAESHEQQDLDGREIFTLYTPKREGVTHNQIATILNGSKHVKLEPIIVSRYMLAALSQEHTINFDPQELCLAFMRTYIANGPKSDITQMSKLVAEALLDSIALLINKWSATFQKVAAGAETPMDVLRSVLTPLPDTLAAEKHIVKLGVVCTMAANLRGAHMEAKELMMLLTKQCANSRCLSQYMGLICKPAEILQSQNHSVARAISESRPFHICVPELRKMYREAAAHSDGVAPKVDEIKSNILTAFIAVVQKSTTKTVMSSIHEIFPMLLLTLQNSHVPTFGHNMAIDCMSSTLIEKVDVMEEHLRSVVKALIVHVDRKSGGAAFIRQKCLALLGKIPQYPMLVPGCRSVQREMQILLARARGDPARIVREEAVHCYSAWYFQIALPAQEEDDN